MRLRRLASGKFDVHHAIEFEQLIKLGPEEFEQRIIPMLKLVG